MNSISSRFSIDSAINAMDVSREGAHLVVAGRSLLKVYSLASDSWGVEQFNLRSSNLKSLNFSNNDVTWCPLVDGVLATAATNGGVVVWNLNNAAKSKIDVVFNDHKRTVNKVCFHSADPNYLLSGSQDGNMKLFDLRIGKASATFVSNSESVRDVQFAPSSFSHIHFASVQETGNVEIWDIRRTDKPESNFIAHDGPVFACEWHPNQEAHKWLATGGRDKTIKVWDMTNSNKPKIAYNVHTIAPVSKLKWRPGKDMHIGSCSLVVDFSVYVWDIMRPYVPYATFATQKDVTTGFAWKGDSDAFEFISTCKDGTVYEHHFETDAYYPAEHYPPIGIDLNPAGDVIFSVTDFIHQYSQFLNTPNSASINNNQYASNLITSALGGNTGNSNELQPMSSRLVKTPSLGTNTIITPNGFISGGGGRGGQNLSNPTEQYTLSSSLNQSNWEMPVVSASVETKSNRNIISIANHYLPSQFQYHHSQQNQQQNYSVFSSNYLTTQGAGNPPIYNISVPISYKQTPEHVLSEHFRCMLSYMMLFLSRDVTDISHGLQQSYNSVSHFVELAKSYKLADESFEELCEFNAGVADRLDLYQVAQTWRLVRHMFSIVGRHPTSSGGGAGGNTVSGTGNNNPSGGSVTANNLSSQTDMKMMRGEENPSRHTSGGAPNASVGRHLSGSNPQNIPSSSGNAVTGGKENSHKHEDEDESELQNIDSIDAFYRSHNNTHDRHGLKEDHMAPGSIPKSRFATDFFDVPPTLDGLNSGFDYYDSEVTQASQRGGGDVGGNSGSAVPLYDPSDDYELKHESILHRHTLFYSDEFGGLSNPTGDFTGGGGNHQNYDISSPVSFDDDDEQPANEGHSFGLFDANLQSLQGAKYLPPPNWQFTDIVTKMLLYYVDAGDVQTTISIILVLGERMRQLTSLDRPTIAIWYRAYIDLLHRFQLWNVACRLMKLSPEVEIQAINQTGTTVAVYCAKCMKAIKPGSVCEKCSMEPTNCAVCHVAVRGMFTWCQGCAHGGHLQHMRQWFKTNALCPSGCGHHCELC